MNKCLIFVIPLLITFSCIESETKSNSFEKVLVLGNSITKHAPYPSIGWYGNWGMAASLPEKDFVHVLSTKMNSNVKPVNTSWESEHRSFDLSIFDVHFAEKPDLIIIRLGENVLDLVDFQHSFSVFVNYIQSKNPDAKSIIAGTIWENDDVNSVLQHVAEENDIPFVSLRDLDRIENQSYIGATIFDEHGTPHKVIDEGVAIHPGDLGMEEIASTLHSAIQEAFVK